MPKILKSIQSLIQQLANPLAKAIKSSFHSENLLYKFKVTKHHHTEFDSKEHKEIIFETLHSTKNKCFG